MAKQRFYRVTSNTSALKYKKCVGFVAGDTSSVRSLSPRTYFEKRKARKPFERHMDWSNEVPMPFISTYSQKRRAEKEAKRRVDDGEDDVVLWTIEVGGYERSVKR